jgi:flagellar biosynthesis chaperone FliJ
VLVIHDITERKVSENEIRKLNEELEKVAERTAQLASQLKHLSKEKYQIVEDVSDVVHTSQVFHFTSIPPVKLTDTLK